MKVAFVFYLHNTLGGAERRLLRAYSLLCSTNSSVKLDIIIRGTDSENALKCIKYANCNVDYFNKIICFNGGAESLKYLAVNHYDIIHYFEGNRFNTILQLIAFLKKEKTVYTICGYMEAYNTAPKAKMKWVKRQIRIANTIDVLYPSGIDFIRSVKSNANVEITPGTFTDLKCFNPGEKKKIMVFAAARLEQSKNPMLLIEACNQVKEYIRENQYQIVVLGQGKLEKEIIDKIEKYGIKDIVHLEGYRRTEQYLPNARVFFSLQREENYPSQALAEATACGCYLIITDVGDSRRCANSNFASFINIDSNELADAILYYINMNEFQKKQIISEARKFAENAYSIEKSSLYYQDILEKLVHSNKEK